MNEAGVSTLASHITRQERHVIKRANTEIPHADADGVLHFFMARIDDVAAFRMTSGNWPIAVEDEHGSSLTHYTASGGLCIGLCHPAGIVLRQCADADRKYGDDLVLWPDDRINQGDTERNALSAARVNIHAIVVAVVRAETRRADRENLLDRIREATT